MDYEPLMGRLIQNVVRLFYDTPQIIFIDLLVKRMLIFDSEIAGLLKIVPKEFNKLVFKLKEDKIIKQETKIEHRENNYQEIKQAFYINYGEVKDVIKYKVFKMTKLLEAEMNKSEEIFVCKTCKKEFSILDAQTLMEGFFFKCDECRGDLEESRRVIENDPHNLHSFVMATIKPLVEILKEIDKIDVPFMDYFQVLELKKRKDSFVVVKKEEIIEKIEIKEEEPLVLGEFDENELKQEPEEIKHEAITERNHKLVNVEGKLKAFNEITEEDLQKMSELEYEKYYEIYYENNSQ